MKPMRPVIPGSSQPEVIYAKDQPEYLPLPAFRHGDESGTITTRWSLTWYERWRVFVGGSIWLSVLTFNQPLQPLKLDAECPVKQVNPMKTLCTASVFALLLGALIGSWFIRIPIPRTPFEFDRMEMAPLPLALGGWILMASCSALVLLAGYGLWMLAAVICGALRRVS